MTKDIAATRDSCAVCNGNAPSEPAMPSITPETPLYPFQHICGDFFHHLGTAYLVLVDRFSNWPVVSQSRDGAAGLIQTLRDTFATYGIPDSLTSDGGPEFASHATRTFLTDWGVHHRMSSAYHSHARQLPSRSGCQIDEAPHRREHWTRWRFIRCLPQGAPHLS